jgi:hypothetical protein
VSVSIFKLCCNRVYYLDGIHSLAGFCEVHAGASICCGPGLVPGPIQDDWRSLSGGTPADRKGWRDRHNWQKLHRGLDLTSTLMIKMEA